MYQLRNVKHLHLEITTKCNAGCPMCPRHYPYTSIVNKNIEMVDMNIDMAKTILKPNLIANLSDILICGNYGDAIANKDAIAIFSYIRNLNPKIKIKLATNGGARDSEFWKNVAHLIDIVEFGIDGLKDTNHLYRQFVNWDLLERNVKTYVTESQSLGKRWHSTWIMNVFKHNEHQISQARELSQSWGISQFKERFTDRFFSSIQTKTHEWPVYDKTGILTHIISPAKQDIISDTAHENISDIINARDKICMTDRFELTKEILHRQDVKIGDRKILCKAQTNHSIYIDYLGRLYPCCWFASAKQHPGFIEAQQIKQIYEEFGENFNNLNYNSIESIFDSGIFEEIELRWFHKNFVNGKPIECAKRCGIGALTTRVK